MTHQVDRGQLRKFGLLVGGILGAIGLWPMIVRAGTPRLWALSLGVGLVLPALIVPQALRPIHRMWMALGNALGWVNTRLILGAIFFGLVTPLGLVMRLLRQDPLRREFDRQVESYRVWRQPRDRSHLTHQF